MNFEKVVNTNAEITSIDQIDYLYRFNFIGYSSRNEFIVLINKENQLLVLESYSYKFPEEKTVYYPMTSMIEAKLTDNDIKYFKESQENNTERDWFFEFVNHNLDDPFIEDDEELNGKELTWAKGNEEEFLSKIQMIIWADETIKEYPFFISFSSQTDEDPAKIDESDKMSRDTEELLEALLDEYQPDGFSWEYNDGAYDLKSGYYNSSYYFEYEIEKPTPHEKVDASIKLKKWLNV